MEKFFHEMFDIELTNRCNALCFFCPRDKTPAQGFITESNFKKAIDRVLELEKYPEISLTGQGEPTLHPEIISFIRHAKQQGLVVRTTSNGSLLTEELTQGLIDTGLDGITFSVSDLEDTYEQVYNLDFEHTMDNIKRFIDKSNGAVEIIISIVEHELNMDQIDDAVKFWKALGANKIIRFGQVNRGGACNNGHQFLSSSRFTSESEQLMRQRGISSLCQYAFQYIFVGWTGDYYVCCNDYEKKTPLGHVSDVSISDLNGHKLVQLAQGGISACVNCSIDPTNEVREMLFNIESGYESEAALDQLLTHLKKRQTWLPKKLKAANWQDEYLQQVTLIASSDA